MCELCLNHPCRTACPNEVIPDIGKCDACGEPITVGSRYADIFGNRVCEDCIDNMSRCELLEMCGIFMADAEVAHGA